MLDEMQVAPVLDQKSVWKQHSPAHKNDVSPVRCCQQLLLAERSGVRIAPWFEVPVDALFNFFPKLAGDNLNWFPHNGVSDFGSSN